MTKTQTIKQLYTLALAEGEGIGTAYEYYAKRLILLPWVARGERPKRMLVAGLPEKYGSSLDFLLLGAELGSQVTVVDERQESLSKLSQTVDHLEVINYLPPFRPQLIQTGSITSLVELSKGFDLVVSSEVVQRLTPELRTLYFLRLQELSPRAAIFAPNGGNESHIGLSGLGGLQLGELGALFKPSKNFETTVGYLDVPPFPPGITRSEAQREEARTGQMEAFAMWGLGIYARCEKFFPEAARQRWAHIVFGLHNPRQR